jgi:hypothetical protein
MSRDRCPLSHGIRYPLRHAPLYPGPAQRQQTVARDGGPASPRVRPSMAELECLARKIPKSGDVTTAREYEAHSTRPDKEAREGGRSYDGPWT